MRKRRAQVSTLHTPPPPSPSFFFLYSPPPRATVSDRLLSGRIRTATCTAQLVAFATGGASAGAAADMEEGC